MDPRLKKYRPCSGQSRTGKRTWGICLLDYESMPWWRAKGAGGGNRRLFKTYETALKACLRMEVAEGL